MSQFERRMRNLLIVIGALAAAGCADLSGVREFASLSASITGSSALSARWRDTQERLAKIPLPGDVPISVPTGDRTQAHEETEKMLALVTTYMEVMGELASDQLPRVDAQVSGLKAELNALPGTPVNRQRVEAFGVVVSLLSKPLDAYRHLKVRELIAAADPHLQAILAGLEALAGIYRADLATERKIVKDWMALHLAGTPAGNTAADFLSRRYLSDLDRKYTEIEQGLDAYVKALRLIAAKHESLVNGLATRQTIERTLPQLKAARRELIEARNRMSNALAQRI